MASLDSVSISWTRTRVHPARLLAARGTPALRDETAYADAWSKAPLGLVPDWRPPWDQDRSFSRFWSYELKDGYRSGAVTGHQAWRKQVPLRRKEPVSLSTTLAGVTVTCAQYLFPTGAGVVVTAEVAGPLAPADLVRVAERLAAERVLSIGQGAPQSLAQVLGVLLDGVDTLVLGGPDPAAVSDPRPRTVASVTRSTDWPLTPVEDGGDVHRLLEALCRMTGAPLAGGAVRPLDKTLMETTQRYADTVRAAVGDGQAVWSPFLAQSPDQAHKLECYHRSLTLSAMQTSLFLATVRWAAGLSQAQLASSELEAVKVVVAMLGQLYGKGRDVYAASLVHRQIDDSGLVPDLRRLRVQLGLGDLPASTLSSPAAV